ncbi:DUF5365 family protein [Bacillus ectoiniformans]|uniref:DUF5365 family protein n=1 Tax=Bacillus ectoiniformans TaxID=1494429 RepID=UPI0030843B8D
MLVASTIEQEDKIIELVRQIKEQIFPHYFSEAELRQWEEIGVLSLGASQFEYFGTLRDAFLVITSLQTIISILETKQLESLSSHYKDMFLHNAETLQRYEICFPFTLDQFSIQSNSFPLYSQHHSATKYLN